MRTATLFLLFATVRVFAAPQEQAKPKAEAARFEAIPPSVSSGQTAQLTWNVEGATNVTIQPVVGSVPASGSAPVSPAETTTYTLTAVTPAGNITAKATVTVGPAATPTTAAPPAATPETPAAPPAMTGPPKIPVPQPKPADIDPGKLAAPSRNPSKSPAVPVDDTFVLGAEDQIEVFVYGSPEFSGQHMIRPDGKITLNFIGEVHAADLTPVQLSDVIKDKIKKYVVDPDVSVRVLQVKSKRFYIQGEVNRTGEFPLVVPTRVLEALVNAGGFRDFANKKKIVIMRGTANGQPESLKFNYNDVIKGKHMEQNIYLQNGDIIIVH